MVRIEILGWTRLQNYRLHYSRLDVNGVYNRLAVGFCMNGKLGNRIQMHLEMETFRRSSDEEMITIRLFIF